MDLRVARFGEYKDPDEAVRADPAKYKKALSEAVGVWDYIVDSIFTRHNKASGEGKAEISREVVPVLTSIPDKIVQAHYIEVVADKLGIPTEAVTAEVEETAQKEKSEKEVVSVTPPKKVEKGRRQLLEERLLTLAFQSDPKILLEDEVKKLIITPLPSRILEEYVVYSRKNLSFSPSEFSENLPKELLDGFAEMALKDMEELTEDPIRLGKELSMVKRELQVMEIRRKLEETGAKIREFEEAGKSDKLLKAQEKFSKLSKTLSELEEEGRGGIILQEG
jgi:DNA primase